jgi:hypothetical protein
VRRTARPRIPPALAILLATGALLAIAWALVLPPLQGPDESAHITAVTRLVEEGRLTGGGAGLPRELLVLAREGNLGPLVGNIAARPAWTAADRRRAEAALAKLGDRRAQLVQTSTGPPTQGSAHNPPLYTAYQAIPYTVLRGGSLLDRLALMRLWNIPLLLITIAACWLLAAEALPGVALAPLIGGGLAALQPELLFLTGVVNPDSALVALTSVFCLLGVRILRRGITRGRAAGLIAVTLAAMLTHFRGSALIPCAALALLLALPWRSYAPERRRRVVAAIVAATAIVIAVGVAFAHATGATLSGTSLHSSQGFSPRQFASYVWQFYLPRLPFMNAPLGGDYGIRQVGIDTAWGTFASLEVQLPQWVFDAIEAVIVAVAASAVTRAVRRGTTGAGVRTAVLLAAVAVATMAVLHVAAYQLLLVAPSDPVIVGRQLLVLIGPFGVLLAYAVTWLGRLERPVVALLFGALVALDLAALGLTYTRFYA